MLYLVSGTNSLYLFVNLILVPCSFSISYSPILSPITSSSFDSPLCTYITPSHFHSRLKTYLFHKSHPVVSFLPPGLPSRTDYCPDRFFWATRFLFLVFLKPRPHQQQWRSNIVECYKSNDSFDIVECCLDIFAGFGNNVKRNFVLSTKSKQNKHVQFVSTLSKGRYFTTNFDIVAGVDGALFFFISVTCARLGWPSRQLLSACKYTVSYRIVS